MDEWLLKLFKGLLKAIKWDQGMFSFDFWIKKLLFSLTGVVYFDQQTGGLPTACWLESSFSAF